MFRKLGRFDYKVEDCGEFHESVKTEIVPLIEKLQTRRKEKLHIENLRPWDLDVNEDLKPPLKPFSDARELISGTINCLSKINPVYADYIMIMEKGRFPHKLKTRQQV